MSKSIALCMITSRADEAKTRALGESLKKYVDEVVITVADKDDKADFKWCDDFSKARNYNFSLTKADWILWLDADDTLEHPENLRNLVDLAEENKITGYWVKYQYAFDKSGNCVDEHWKAQLLKNNGNFKWMGPVHEDPIQTGPCVWTITNDIVRVHHSNHGEESHNRNLTILEKWVVDEPKEPRAKFYLGRAYLSCKKYKEAIDVLQEYLELSGWDDERYEARLLIGQAYVQLNDIDTAILVYHDAILEKESNPDAYIYKGMCYMRQQKFQEALYNFEIALDLPVPNAVTYFNPMFYKRDVYSAVAIANMNLGRLDEANNAILLALKADKENEELRTLYGAISRLREKKAAVQNIIGSVKYAEKHDPAKIHQILTATPADLWDNEVLAAIRKKFLSPKTWGKKTIAVYCGHSAEDWSPDSLNNGGIGGSETAVIELTKRLVKQGWDITVFNQGNHPPAGREFDGVKYQNYWLFNPDDTYDVLWVWRIPAVFDFNLKARLTIFDVHDVMSQTDFTPERLAKMNKIFVKTKFHRSLFPNVPDDKFVIVGNGIDLTRFEEKVEKDPYRFCYTSSPNRGLDIVLKIWPKIKEKLPEATLHVYYGWKTFYEIEKHNPERLMWMKKIQALMQQDGVVDHGRVGQKELAQDLLKTSYWLYPTYFPEIDCITAKEMQAAGVVPITSGYAALEESQHIGITVPGDVYDPAWQQRYVDTVLSADDERNTPFDASVFSWDKVATTWQKELQ